jgi:ketosteroid isomerase-like protein
MSEENVETVQRIYGDISAQLWGTGRELFDPDCEFDLTDAALGLIRGVEAAEEVLRAYWEAFEDFQTELTEVIHADEEHVVTAIRDGGRMKASGTDIWNRFFHVWTFRDGKVIRFSTHTDKSRALEAAGLRA